MQAPDVPSAGSALAPASSDRIWRTRQVVVVPRRPCFLHDTPDGMVALLKEFYGRGLTRTKSYYEDDLVVCVLRGGFCAWSGRCSTVGVALR
jgi:hypothetical protein